ncbi:MAG: hypothetical protein ACLSFO_01580 [Anaerovoracaceae bacterium]
MTWRYVAQATCSEPKQHGHIVNVGYELYCKMVDDAVRALEGEIVNDDKEEITIDLKAPLTSLKAI